MSWFKKVLRGNSEEFTDTDSRASGHSKRSKKQSSPGYSSMPNLASCVFPKPPRSNRIGEKLYYHNASSNLDLSSPLPPIDETDHASETDGNKAETERNLQNNSSSSSDAEDPSEIISDAYVKCVTDDSIHVGHTEPTSTSFLKRCFSSELKGRSLDNLSDVGVSDERGDRESSLGYGTEDGGAVGLAGNQDREGQGFRGSQPDWRDIFSTSYRSNNSDASTRDDEQPDESRSPTSPTAPVTLINIYGSHASVMTNIGQDTGTDDSRLSRYGSQAKMVTVHGSSKEKSISERTEALLHTFESEKSRVLTRATKKAIEKLTSKAGDNVVIVVGHRFDGKRYTAMTALSRMTDTWQVASVNTPEEMDEVESRDGLKTCFCIMDIFSKTEFSKSNLERWEPRFEEMLSKARARKIGIIITMNKLVYEKYIMEFQRHDLFKEENILDLTKEYSLTHQEKMGIVKCQLQLFHNASNVVFTENKDEDNTYAFQTGGELCIWEGYLEEIVAIPCTSGFPKQTEIYSSKIEYIQMRSDFFKQALTFHRLAVRNICQSKETADEESGLAIKTVFACKGKTDVTRLQERYASCAKSSKKSICKSSVTSKVPDGNSILKQIMKDVRDAEDAVTKFNNGTMNIRNWILVQENDDVVKFSSPANHLAATIFMSKQFDTAEVIRCAPREFIYSCIYPSNGKERSESVLFIHKTPRKSLVKDELFRRLATDATKAGHVSNVCNHELMTKRWFVIAFIEFLEKNRDLMDFVTRIDAKSCMTVLVHSMNKQYDDAGEKDPQNFAEDLLPYWRRHCKDVHLKRKQEKEALYQACRQGLHTTFVRFRKHLDPMCLRLAVEAGSAEITEDILMDKRFISFSDLSDTLALACRTHCKSNPAAGLKLARVLQRNNCSIDRKDGDNDPLIHEAVAENNVHLIEFLYNLDNDRDLDIKDKKGNRPLHNCVLLGNIESADALLAYGADPTKTNNNHLTPLHLAVTKGSLRLVRNLAMHGTCLNALDRKGRTALHLALEQDMGVDMLQSLIAAGADVRRKDGDEHSPLYYAVVTENLEAMRLLMAAGASVSDTDRNKKIIMEVAVARKSRRVLECIIESSLDLKRDETEVPFSLIEFGDVTLVEECIKHGCKLSCRNKKGDSLMKYAIEKNNIDIVSLLCEKDTSLIRLVCKGMSPLHTAISSVDSSFEISNFLIASGASIVSRTESGDTPLHLACMYGRLDVIQLLLEIDENLLHERNYNGMTVLHTAAENGQLEVVQVLLFMEADPHAKTKQPPMTPLDLALRKRNFYNEFGRIDIGKVKSYDQVMGELRRTMYGKKRYASTMELRSK